jgi:hypothetical protein
LPPSAPGYSALDRGEAYPGIQAAEKIAREVEENRRGEADAVDPVKYTAMTGQKGSEILDAAVALGGAHDEASGKAHQAYDERQQSSLQDSEWRDPVEAGANQADEDDTAREALDGLVRADIRRDRVPSGELADDILQHIARLHHGDEEQQQLEILSHRCSRGFAP